MSKVVQTLFLFLVLPGVAFAEQALPRARLPIKDVGTFNRQALILKLTDKKDFYRRELEDAELRIARIQAVAEEQGYLSHLYRILSVENPVGGGLVVFGPVGSGALLYATRKQARRIGLIVGAVGVSEETLTVDAFASQSLRDVYKLRRLTADELAEELQRAQDKRTTAQRELKELEVALRSLSVKQEAVDVVHWGI